jgi:hypothetical protein
VYFELIGPWSQLRRSGRPAATATTRIGRNIFLAALLLALAVAAISARRNMRLGRVDRRGAARLVGASAVFTVTANLLLAVPLAMTVGVPAYAVLLSAGLVLIVAGTFWLLYVALEPYLRRRWPQSLTSWARLLDGRVRDPLVGRDVLIGIAGGVLIASLDPIAHYVQQLAGQIPEPRLAVQAGQGASVPMTWNGPSAALAQMLFSMVSAVAIALVFIMVFHLLHLLLGRLWLAGTAYLLMFSLFNFTQQGDQVILVIGTVVGFGLALFVLVRFGVLAFVGMYAARAWIAILMPSWDFATWYGSANLLVMTVILGVTGYAFHTALGGRSLIPDPLLEAPKGAGR